MLGTHALSAGTFLPIWWDMGPFSGDPSWEEGNSPYVKSQDSERVGNHPYMPIASMYGMFTYFTIKFNTSIWWLIHPSRPKQHLFARPRRALPLHPHVGPREVFLVKS